MKALLALPCLTGLLVAQQPPALQPLLDGLRAKPGVPALAAAVVRDGKIVAVAVSGLRELGKPEPVTLKDRWVVGSCTKAMTRLLLCRLAQDGKVRLDQSLAEAFPGVGMNPGYAKATVTDLVRHTAGLPAYTRITPKLTPIVFELKGDPRSVRDRFAAHVLNEPPAGERGRFLYSNAGFSLLGNLAERTAGKPWEDLMRQEVFGPLGMHSAVIGLAAAQAAGPMPTGHAHEDTGFTVARFGPPLAGLFAPAGGVVLTIEDFARFAIAQAAVEGGKGGAYLGPAASASLPALRPADEGPAREGAVFLGGQGSFTAGFAVWPSRQFGVVVATNGGESDEVCEAVVAALQTAYAPELAGPPKPPQGPRLGIMLQGEEDGQLILGGVAPGGLGERAGLKPGDRITAIDGKAIPDLGGPDGVMAALRAPGAKLRVLRAGKLLELVLPTP